MDHTFLFADSPKYIVFLIEYATEGQLKVLLVNEEYPPCLEETFNRNSQGLYEINVMDITKKVFRKIFTKMAVIHCKYKLESIPNLSDIIIISIRLDEILEPDLEGLLWTDFTDEKDFYQRWLNSIDKHIEVEGSYFLAILNLESLQFLDKPVYMSSLSKEYQSPDTLVV